MPITFAYHTNGSQPLLCNIPPQQQHQQQHQQLAWHQQPQSPPELAVYYQTAYCPPATQLSPLNQARPYDLGYESDTKEHLLQQHQQQQQYPYHQLQSRALPPQQQQQHQLLTNQFRAPNVVPLALPIPATKAAGSSPGSSSTCDSARAESPADAQLAELAGDLEGYSLPTGQRQVDMALSQTMEIVWHQRFNQFFARFNPDTWRLIPVFDQPDLHNTRIDKSQWRYFKDQAKVRFICICCQKAWTSMGGQVVFWIFRDPVRKLGYVCFKLYGQKCTDCCPDYYEHAIWYQEEVEKVVENLFHHVGQLCYGQQAQRRRVDRRPGQPRKEHNTGTCLACQENVCRMGQVLRKKMCTESA